MFPNVGVTSFRFSLELGLHCAVYAVQLNGLASSLFMKLSFVRLYVCEAIITVYEASVCFVVCV